MGVSVESTDVLLTWDEFASRSWENEADTWDNPHFVAFTVSSSENAPAFAEVGVAAAAFFRDISEGLGFAEVYDRQADFNMGISEGLGFAEVGVAAAAFFRNISEGLGFAEVYDRQADFNMGISEGLGFAEIRSCDVTISPFMRGLGFAEVITKGAAQNFPVGLGFAEVYDRQAAFNMGISEGLGFAEVYDRQAAFNMGISVGLGFAEVYDRQAAFNMGISVGLGFAEVYDRQAAFNMGISEGLGFAEIRSCDVTISPFMRGLGFAELIEKGPNKIIPEGLGFAENYTRQSVFDKDIAVSLSFGENPAKSASVFLTEAFRLSDYMLLPFCTGILSDIALLSAPVSESEIADMAGQSYPHGFSAWRRFDDGEFEFRKALVKLIMESEDAEGAYDSKVTDHKVVSDVFDIMESGVLTITRASHRVTFKKRFHRIPVISVTSLNTTAFAIPEVQEVTRTYFDIRLRVANGDSASGNISWRASGY